MAKTPTKPVVAFDETGHTGANLLDPEQPVFVLASVHLSDEDTECVIGRGAQEVKFARLKRSRDGRRRIVENLNSPSLTEDRFLVSGTHKSFMVVAKMVDLLVEPLAHKDGINLYERGANIALSNMLFFCLPVFLGRKPFALIQTRFVEMVRTRSLRAIEAFYRTLESAYTRHRHEKFADDLAMLLATRPVAEQDARIWNDGHLDPSIPDFVVHASMWTRRLGAPFTIIHDQSKPLMNERALLEAMMSTSEQSIEIGYDRRKMLFPIMADGIEFRDSREVKQLQVSDLLAGSAGHCLKATARGAQDRFAAELLETRALAGRFLPLWPEPKVSPEDLGTTEVGGIDAVDFVAKYVSRRIDKVTRNPKSTE